MVGDTCHSARSATKKILSLGWFDDAGRRDRDHGSCGLSATMARGYSLVSRGSGVHPDRTGVLPMPLLSGEGYSGYGLGLIPGAVMMEEIWSEVFDEMTRVMMRRRIAETSNLASTRGAMTEKIKSRIRKVKIFYKQLTFKYHKGEAHVETNLVSF